jgi:hypothetical protein
MSSGNDYIEPPAPQSYDELVALAQMWNIPADQIESMIGTPQDVQQRNIDTAQRTAELTGTAPSWAADVGYSISPEQQAAAIQSSGLNYNPALASADYSSNTNPIVASYNTILGRNPTQEEINAGISKMGADNLGLPSLISDLSSSAEAKNLLNSGVISQSMLDKANQQLPGAFGYLYPRTRESFLQGAGNFMGNVVRYGVPAIMAIGGGLAALGEGAAAGAGAAEGVAGGTATGTGVTGGAGAANGLVSGGTVGSIVAPTTGGALGLAPAAEAAIAAGAGADLLSSSSSFAPGGVNGLNAALPSLGSVGGAGAMSAALPAGTIIGDGTLGTTLGATYMAAAPGQFAVDALGNAIPASSVGINGFAPTTSLLDSLPSFSSLSPLSSLLGPASKILSTALNNSAKNNTNPQQLLNPNMSGMGGYSSTNSGITNLTPGLTQANLNYSLAGLPAMAETTNPMHEAPVMHAAIGGSASKENLFDEKGAYNYANVSDAKLTPFVTKHKIDYTLSGIPTLNKAEGGLINEPQFYSEGGASMANRYVKGDGDGTSDSIPAMLANGEFVIPADVVSGLGNGSNDSGAKVLDEFLKVIRKHKQKHDVKKLPPNSKGALAYLTDAKRKVKK